jgi:L-iditol 2-dehydrogenase/threonine 3-dehydrogenase
MFYLGEHELNVFGSMMYKHEDYLAAVEMIESGKINLEPLISKHFSFEEYLQAYNFIEEKADKSMKVIIDL